MKKNFFKFVVILTLAAVICLPGMAAADYVQGWTENGIYQGAYQTWNKMEIFLKTPGNWTGTGVSNFSAAGWSASLINPQYALATGSLYDSSISGNFTYTTYSTDRTDPYIWDMFLWLDDQIVGVQHSVYSAGGWTYTDVTNDPPPENRSHVSLPPTVLLLLSGLAGLGLLHRRQGAGRCRRGSS